MALKVKVEFGARNQVLNIVRYIYNHGIVIFPINDF